MGEGRAPDLNEQYRAFTEHWKHTDQIRQLLLYNFLMASTILVAAWGLLYSYSATPQLLLKALSGLGVILSVLWYGVARRATGYYDMYEAQASQIEACLPESQRWPFHARATYRHNVPRVSAATIRAAAITSGVPTLFFVLFSLLLGLCLSRFFLVWAVSAWLGLIVIEFFCRRSRKIEAKN